MRGIGSEGMILCASTLEKVEILNVPIDCKIGDRVSVEGLFGKPDEILNPKEKVLENVLPKLQVNENGIASYDNMKLKLENSADIIFKSETLVNCQVK